MSTLWHAGGANQSDKPRMALTNQHCQPWIRPQVLIVIFCVCVCVLQENQK